MRNNKKHINPSDYIKKYRRGGLIPLFQYAGSYPQVESNYEGPDPWDTPTPGMDSDFDGIPDGVDAANEYIWNPDGPQNQTNNTEVTTNNNENVTDDGTIIDEGELQCQMCDNGFPINVAPVDGRCPEGSMIDDGTTNPCDEQPKTEDEIQDETVTQTTTDQSNTPGWHTPDPYDIGPYGEAGDLFHLAGTIHGMGTDLGLWDPGFKSRETTTTTTTTQPGQEQIAEQETEELVCQMCDGGYPVNVASVDGACPPGSTPDDGTNPCDKTEDDDSVDSNEEKIEQDSGEKTFDEAFAEARSQGLEEFTWNGKSYHTKTKEEVDGENNQKTLDTLAGGIQPPQSQSEIDIQNERDRILSGDDQWWNLDPNLNQYNEMDGRSTTGARYGKELSRFIKSYQDGGEDLAPEMGGTLSEVDLEGRDPNRTRAWWRRSKQKVSDLGHGILDAAGMVPVFGEIADGINALWYSAEGDHLNAGLSAAGMIPFVGWGATAGKWGLKGKKYLKQVDKIQKKIDNKVPNKVKDGNVKLKTDKISDADLKYAQANGVNVKTKQELVDMYNTSNTRYRAFDIPEGLLTDPTVLKNAQRNGIDVTDKDALIKFIGSSTAPSKTLRTGNRVGMNTLLDPKLNRDFMYSTTKDYKDWALKNYAKGSNKYLAKFPAYGDNVAKLSDIQMINRIKYGPNLRAGDLTLNPDLARTLPSGKLVKNPPGKLIKGVDADGIPIDISPRTTTFITRPGQMTIPQKNVEILNLKNYPQGSKVYQEFQSGGDYYFDPSTFVPMQTATDTMTPEQYEQTKTKMETQMAEQDAIRDDWRNKDGITDSIRKDPVTGELTYLDERGYEISDDPSKLDHYQKVDQKGAWWQKGKYNPLSVIDSYSPVEDRLDRVSEGMDKASKVPIPIWSQMAGAIGGAAGITSGAIKGDTDQIKEGIINTAFSAMPGGKNVKTAGEAGKFLLKHGIKSDAKDTAKDIAVGGKKSSKRQDKYIPGQLQGGGGIDQNEYDQNQREQNAANLADNLQFQGPNTNYLSGMNANPNAADQPFIGPKLPNLDPDGDGINTGIDATPEGFDPNFIGPQPEPKVDLDPDNDGINTGIDADPFNAYQDSSETTTEPSETSVETTGGDEEEQEDGDIACQICDNGYPMNVAPVDGKCPEGSVPDDGSDPCAGQQEAKDETQEETTEETTTEKTKKQIKPFRAAIKAAEFVNAWSRKRADRKAKRLATRRKTSDYIYGDTANKKENRGQYDPNTGMQKPNEQVFARQGKYGKELQKYLQSGGPAPLEADYNFINAGGCKGGGCAGDPYKDAGASAFVGVEGSNLNDALLQGGLKAHVGKTSKSGLGYNLSGEAGAQTNLMAATEGAMNPELFYKGKLSAGYTGTPMTLGQAIYPGANVGGYGEYDSNSGVNLGIEGGYGPVSIKGGYNVDTGSPFLGAGLNLKFKDGSEVELDNNTIIELIAAGADIEIL